MIYRAILGVLQGGGTQKDFAALVMDIRVQHLAWLSSLLLAKTPSQGSDDGSDVSVDVPV